MNSDSIFKRLNGLNSSHGSIVSTAIWCAMQCPSNTELIVKCIIEKMREADTVSEIRCSLLFVLHELLLSLSHEGVPPSTKRRLLVSVSHFFPETVKEIEKFPDVLIFSHALERVLGWWQALHLFQDSWLHQLHISTSSPTVFIKPTEVGGSWEFNDIIKQYELYLTNKNRLADMLERKTHSLKTDEVKKIKLEKEDQINDSMSENSTVTEDSLKTGYIDQLITLIRAITGKEPSSLNQIDDHSFLGRLLVEWREYSGLMPISSKESPISEASHVLDEFF